VLDEILSSGSLVQFDGLLLIIISHDALWTWARAISCFVGLLCKTGSHQEVGGGR
jgi:hypothetical protein